MVGTRKYLGPLQKSLQKSCIKKPLQSRKKNIMILLNCVPTSGIIPNEFHEEYLQMRNSSKTQDRLQETDEEDETVSLK